MEKKTSDLKMNEEAFVQIIKQLEGLYAQLVSSQNELEEKNKQLEEAKRQLEENIAYISAVMNNMVDGLLVTDKNGKITNVNLTMLAMFGFMENDVLGKSCKDVFSTELADLVEKALKHRRYIGEVFNKEIDLPGDRVGMVTAAAVYEDLASSKDECLGSVILIRDITAAKEAEKELKKAKEIAEEAALAKSEFLATMSHEIRTPMNAIIGMADLLWETELTPEQKQYVQVFRSAGESLLGIINDILDISKIEAGRLTLESIDFNLRELLEKVCEIMAVRAHEKGLELAYHIAPDVPVELMGDPLRLRQILTNLIGNALKFTEKGEVVVKIKKQEEKDGVVEMLFSVRDTGIGIPPEKVNSLFKKFTQVDSSTTRKYGGTGLGLSISKNLVELMGGRIWIESKLGEGSTFYFTIKAPLQSEPRKETQVIAADIKGLKVLVVDDNETNRLILRETLLGWGAIVTETDNGEAALFELKKAKEAGEPFKLVLLDCRMPGMDGFAVAEQIKNDENLAGMIVMMLTSDNRDSHIQKAKEVGITKYLVKPLKRSDLWGALTSVLGKVKIDIERRETPDALLEELHPLNILLVDDSSDNRLLIQSYLKKTPYKIDIGENGQMALEKFTSGKYDIVLMDIQMPVMDGYTATREIRKWEVENRVEATPIIALTAYALKEEIQKCLDAGCNDCLTKPVKKVKLLEMIKQWTKKQ